VARTLLVHVLGASLPAGEVVIGVDDTIERRWGSRIKARGLCRNPVRSSHGHFVRASGLRWLSLMVMVPIPWAKVAKISCLCRARHNAERFLLSGAVAKCWDKRTVPRAAPVSKKRRLLLGSGVVRLGSESGVEDFWCAGGSRSRWSARARSFRHGCIRSGQPFGLDR